MGDQDWLEQGHGGGEGLQPMIKGSSGRAVDRVSIRSVLRGGESASPRPTRRRTKAMVGWLLYCCTAVGGTAAAFTVRDTLFPSLGSPTKAGLWVSSNIDSTLSTERGSTSTSRIDTTVVETTVTATTVSAQNSSIEAPTVPSASAQSQGPGNTTDNGGPAGGAPQTGTTIDNNPSSGPGPGTTVDTRPSDSSTSASATSSPTSVDTTNSSTPSPTDSSGGHQSGKGGGSGGSGGGGTTNP